MKLPLFLAASLSFCLISLSAHAEYRVFQLQITSADGNVKSFTSTLDPDQYRGYHPVRADQKISYIETWKCKGRTGDHLPTCENPNPQPPGEERAPATATIPSDEGPEPTPPTSN